MAGGKHLWKVGASPVSQESKPSRDKARVTPPPAPYPGPAEAGTHLSNKHVDALRKTSLLLAPE